ncbi:hypothetical protein HYI36_13010 [Bacillus sp. Gen3]|nr:hypothetical protein [Bacillus sp. Gen3]
MYLLVDKNTNGVFFIEEKVIEVDNGYLVVMNGQQWQEIPKELFNCIEADISKPDDFEKGKYIFDDAKGLVLNENWTNPMLNNRTILYKELIDELKPIEDSILELASLLTGGGK